MKFRLQNASASQEDTLMISWTFDFNASRYILHGSRAKSIRRVYKTRPEKQLATANLAWYRARVWWFVDAPFSVVCATLGLARTSGA